MSKGAVGVLIGIGVLILIGIGIWAERSHARGSRSGVAVVAGADGPAPGRSVITVSAEKLWTDYQADKGAADNTYRDKLVVVSGQLSSVKKDYLDKTYLTLATPSTFMEVHADLKDQYQSEAAHLTHGQMVSLECECSGTIGGSPMLRDCAIQSGAEK